MYKRQVFNDRALERVFAVKGRPADNPLIVHISDFSQVAALAHELPAEARKLAEYFWPGPLTLVLKKKREISSLVSAGLPTVAIRMPNLSLIHILNGKIRKTMKRP